MAGSILVSLLSSFNDKGIKDAEKAFGMLKDKVSSVGKSLAVSAGSYLAGAKAMDFVKSSVDAAAHLEQNMTGLKSVFRDATKDVLGFVQTSNKMGMSMADSAKAVTFMGSVFKQTGMPMDQVVEKTKTMVSLGADLAATYGYSVDEALTAMTATFRGEYDPIEKFGVAMKQQQVNAELAARGQKNLTGAALIAASQQIRYELILQRTTDAQGAFQRSTKNLVIQQAILKSTFTNMQAVLGSQLTPVITQFALKLQPLIENMMPHMVKLFQSIGVVLTNLLPILPVLADNLANLFEAFGSIMLVASKPISAVATGIAQSLTFLLTFFATFKLFNLVVPLVLKFAADWSMLSQAIGRAGAAQVIFNTSAIATKAALLMEAGAIGVVAGAFAVGIDYVNKYNAAVAGIKGLPKNLQEQANAYANSQVAKLGKSGFAGLEDSTRASALQDWYNRYVANHQKRQTAQMAADWKKVMADIKNGMSDGSVTSATKVKTWFDNLQEEVNKQASRLKLGNLGLSKVLIDSLLNASDWQSAVAKVMGMTKSQIKKLIADFGKTSAAQDAAAADLADRTGKFVDAVKARIETVKSLTDGLASMMPRTLNEVNAQVGQFESDVVSAANTLRGNLASALENKQITQAAYSSLLTYANREIKVMQNLATARDRLAKKIEYAKQVYIEVAQAVRGYGNITSTTTSQVTESYKKIIDGVEVTVSRTVDALQSKDLVTNYKAIVDKTKAFLTNLTSLKKMGLNQTLFKQIIDAGIDAGGATAEAIVQGGSDTVSSLNDMFTQLDAAGAQMADLTASVMQDNGITIVSAFIDGLTSQEKTLSDAAKSMAQIFSDAFNNNVRFVVPTINPGDYGLTAKQGHDALVAAGVDPNQGGSGKNDFNVSVWDALPSKIAPIVKDIIDVVVPPEIPTPVVPTPVVPTPVVPAPEMPPTVTEPLTTAADEVSSSADKLAAIMAAPSVSGGLFSISEIASTLKSQFGSKLSQTYFEKAVTNAANGIEGSTSTMKMWTRRAANLMNTLGNPSDMPAVDTSAATGSSSAGWSLANTSSAATAMGQQAPTYNVTVNAGLGTDGASVGQAVVKILKDYERNNGSVWQAV